MYIGKIMHLVKAHEITKRVTQIEAVVFKPTQLANLDKFTKVSAISWNQAMMVPIANRLPIMKPAYRQQVAIWCRRSSL